MMGLAAMSCRKGDLAAARIRFEDNKDCKFEFPPAESNRPFEISSPVAGIRHFLFISLKRRLAPSATYVTHLPPYE